jgi:hypothetical protein
MNRSMAGDCAVSVRGERFEQHRHLGQFLAAAGLGGLMLHQPINVVGGGGRVFSKLSYRSRGLCENQKSTTSVFSIAYVRSNAKTCCPPFPDHNYFPQ